MPESFMLDTAINRRRSIIVTGSGRIVDEPARLAAPRPAARAAIPVPAREPVKNPVPEDVEPPEDDDTPEVDADQVDDELEDDVDEDQAEEPVAPAAPSTGRGRGGRSKVLTPPTRPTPSTGTKPKAK